jgi:hypothetical protein
MEIEIDGKSVHIAKDSLADVRSVLSLITKSIEQERHRHEFDEEPWPESTIVDGLTASVYIVQQVNDQLK